MHSISFRHLLLQLFWTLQPALSEHTQKKHWNSSVTVSNPYARYLTVLLKERLCFLTNPSFPVIWVYPWLPFCPLTVSEFIHQGQRHILTDMNTHASFQRMQWVKSLNIFKPTAKVIPAMSSPTKLAFSRNAAKQKDMFFHCFPIVLRKAFPYSWRWLPQNLSHSNWGFFWLIFGKHDHPEIITNGDACSIGQTVRYFLCFFSQWKLLTPLGIPHSQPLPVFWSWKNVIQK